MTPTIHELYSRYAPVVFRRCKAILKNDDEAWDGVQEVFFKLAEKPELVSRMASPTAYLFRMATHYSLNRMTRENRSVSPEETEAPDPRAATDDDQIRALFLKRLFAQVPERTRELAWYRWVDQMTWDEVAQASGLSVAGARKHLAKFSAYARTFKEYVS